MTLLKNILTCLGLVATLSLASAAPIDDAEKSLHSTINCVLECLKNGDSKETKRQEIMTTITTAFDFPLMSKLSLGKRSYSKLTEDEKAQYTDLYISQLQNSYLDKLELYSDEKIEFEKAYMEKKRIVIPTKVISGADVITMNYKMYKSKKGAWKVFDVVIEGISVISTYRSQYTSILKDGSVSDLFAKMKEQQKTEIDKL